MSNPRPHDSLAAALDQAHAILTRYVVFPSAEAADAVTLYAAATHAMPALEFAARLVIKSPVKRCGKSRLLDVLNQLVARALITTDISAAALVRSITPGEPPTLLLDEADATFGKALKGDDKAENLRGILNAGFGRDRPYRRWDVASRRMEDHHTFAMAVLAGIGSVPDTIEDRAVIISMRRKAPHERAAKYRIRRDKQQVTEAGNRLAGCVSPLAERVGAAEPDMPAGLNDRAEDVWEALIAVADLAEGDWPNRARKAAIALSSEAEDRAADASLSLRLLTDLREVFGAADAMHSAVIVEALHKISESPWADYFGKPLSQRDLAKLLSPYSVRSRDAKVGGINRKGYHRADLHDVWQCYLPQGQGVSATSATSATAQVSEVVEVAGSACDPLPATSPAPLTWDVAEVAEVADTPGAEGRCGVCGQLLDSTLTSAGYTTHPGCEPDETPGDDPAAEWPDEPPPKARYVSGFMTQLGQDGADDPWASDAP